MRWWKEAAFGLLVIAVVAVAAWSLSHSGLKTDADQPAIVWQTTQRVAPSDDVHFKIDSYSVAEPYALSRWSSDLGHGVVVLKRNGSDWAVIGSSQGDPVPVRIAHDFAVPPSTAAALISGLKPLAR